jgi:hypothetical protein
LLCTLLCTSVVGGCRLPKRYQWSGPYSGGPWLATRVSTAVPSCFRSRRCFPRNRLSPVGRGPRGPHSIAVSDGVPPASATKPERTFWDVSRSTFQRLRGGIPKSASGTQKPREGAMIRNFRTMPTSLPTWKPRSLLLAPSLSKTAKLPSLNLAEPTAEQEGIYETSPGAKILEITTSQSTFPSNPSTTSSLGSYPAFVNKRLMRPRR